MSPIPYLNRLGERLEALEEEARRLEESPGSSLMLAWADRFLEALPEKPVYRPPGQERELADFPIGEEGYPPEKVLRCFERAVVETGLLPSSGRYLGYIPGGGLPLSAWGDFLASLTNEYSGLRFAGPGAVALEEQLIRWICDLVGLPEKSSGGVLTSEGSIANLIAVAAAREAHGLEPRHYHEAVVYTSCHVHHSVPKALRLCGFGQENLVQVAVDRNRRLDPEALEEAILDSRKRGRRPWLVVASAGQTDIGAIDPLAPIAEIAHRHGLWLHVDAAYGGFFLLVPELRERFAGIEEADSVTLDPHKGLFLPYGTGAVLLRDLEPCRRLFAGEGRYLRDARSELPSPADLSPELSRPFRGLRLWLPLLIHGLRPFRAALEEKHLLARYLYQRLREEGFLCEWEPELSIVPFRHPERSQELLDWLKARGRVFVSSTEISGELWLRAAILCFRTHRRHVDQLLEELRRFNREA